MATLRVRRIAAAVSMAFVSVGASAAQPDPEALQRKIDSLQRQVDELKSMMQQMQNAPASTPAGPRAPAHAAPGASGPRADIGPPPGPIPARAGYVELYGHLDLSVDTATKGLDGKTFPAGAPAQGRLGWQPDVSSNLSHIGVRGAHKLGDSGLRGVFQLETQVDVAATPGPSTTPDNTVKGAWASRNSYLGFEGGFGAIKAGKTDAPYKLSTARMDPFSASVGDYNSVIGNTGGDNRAEFDTRLSHAIWYESPRIAGFRVSALFSPGQNRSSDNSNPASGEPNCTGGNQPPCNDGSFGNAYSVAGVYDAGPLYAIAAYEMHKHVNRQGDEVAGGGPAPLGAVDIADEHAWKVGLQYRLPTQTTFNAIYERIQRDAPVAQFNERTHSAYWFALTQKFTARDELNLGWAHANKTPGDPALGPVDNATSLYDIGLKHRFDKQTTAYMVYARQANHSAAHYDLGASGHGITTDCHDATGTCYFGATLQALSIGATYDF